MGPHLQVWLHVVRDPTYSRRTADAAFLFAFLVFSGVYQLAADETAPSVSRFGGPVGKVWAAWLIVWGITALAGIWWRNPRTGLYLEAAARACLGGACVFYAGLLVAANGPRAAAPAFFVLAFAVACGWRWAHIIRWLRRTSDPRSQEGR